MTTAPVAQRSARLSSTTIAMLLADARLPVGAHVSSAGLEPALSGGMNALLTPNFMVGRARTASRVEAGTAVVARAVALGDGDAMSESLLGVESAWAARTPSRALRDISRHLGRGYLRLATHLWGAHPGVVALAEGPAPCSRAVVLGVVAAASGLDAASLARLVIYDDAQTIAAALLKLDPIDPARTAAWVIEACTEGELFVEELSRLTSPDSIPAVGAPQNEEWAEAHSLTTQRLFRA
jgi:urease accessory protein